MMTAGDYGVRVIVETKRLRRGDVIYPLGTVRKHLIAQGVVEPVSMPENVTVIRKAGA